jgi:hypothetical protein
VRHGDHGPAVRPGAPRGRLLAQVGDPDAVRASRDHPGLDRGTDVVGVDVDVPQPAAADHDDRVAELGERRAQHVGRGLLGVEQVHHLVGAAALVEGVDVERHRRRGGARVTAYAGDGLHERLEQHDEPAPAGVDHACPPQHLELLGRAGQRLARGVGGGRDEAGQAGARPERGDRVGRGPGDREDRALPGAGHGGVRRVRRPAERGDPELVLAERLLAGGREGLGDPLDELAEDDPRVPAGAEQGSVGEGRDALPHRRRAALGERRGGRLEGEEQVGAGVAVGHREDVERVDLAAVPPEGVEPQLGPAPDAGRVEPQPDAVVAVGHACSSGRRRT